MAYWTFTPPDLLVLSTFAWDADPVANRLMGHFAPNYQVQNVWIWSDDTVSVNQPPFLAYDPAASLSIPYAARVFYGGGTYTDVTDDEKTLLEGAGYTVS